MSLWTKAVPEFLVLLTPFEVPLPPESLVPAGKYLVVCQLPRPLTARPATLVFLVLFDPPLYAFRETNIQAALGIS